MGFNKELSKKSTLETFNDDSPVDSQGIEIKSPGKMFWFTIKGITYDKDITEVITTKLYDPDGEILEYIIQAEERSLREKIILFLSCRTLLTLFGIITKPAIDKTKTSRSQT